MTDRGGIDELKNRDISYGILTLTGFIMIFPLIMMVTGSFLGPEELRESYGVVLEETSGPITLKLIPDFPTFRSYVELLLDSPDFFVMFWNSCRQVFPILIGQMAVGIPAAWAFAKYDFPGRKILLLVYMILMVMPFQVTMVSNYLVLSKLSLMDTHWGIILPGIFSTFPVFIMEKFFNSIPDALIEAAKIDGANSFQIFLKVGIPLASSGIISSLILNFLEYWNAIEAPMTFLKTKSKLPLSLYLPQITTDQVSVSFVASVVMMIPAILGFLWGQEYLQQGIVASGLKE
ncbi:carbohydrate ABC transporter permease [Blautia liquoris]|uniref:Carbohydrate ABC transporter permease n=1 Tax=Blautia liquoris TaxID=2779518 RepID=A0A7M2RKL4_9FIRM|nr:carbohydrate ABC transporter permease [Blautia liquoris]